jgi:hypothetical protein
VTSTDSWRCAASAARLSAYFINPMARPSPSIAMAVDTGTSARLGSGSFSWLISGIQDRKNKYESVASNRTPSE